MSGLELMVVESDSKVETLVDSDIVVVTSNEESIFILQDLAQGPVGPMGPPGVSGNSTPAYNFSYGDAFPAKIAIIANKRITGVTLFLDTAINGVGASLSVGTLSNNTELLPAMNPSEAAVYEFSPQQVYPYSTDIYLFLVPGSGVTEGYGSIVIESQ
jgi:hypothetical protein